MVRALLQKLFFWNPSKTYSEVLEKSIGGPRKGNEVFGLSVLTGPDRWPSLAAGQRFESRPGSDKEEF